MPFLSRKDKWSFRAKTISLRLSAFNRKVSTSFPSFNSSFTFSIFKHVFHILPIQLLLFHVIHRKDKWMFRAKAISLCRKAFVPNATISFVCLGISLILLTFYMWKSLSVDSAVHLAGQSRPISGLGFEQQDTPAVYQRILNATRCYRASAAN